MQAACFYFIYIDFVYHFFIFFGFESTTVVPVNVTEVTLIGAY